MLMMIPNQLILTAQAARWVSRQIEEDLSTVAAWLITTISPTVMFMIPPFTLSMITELSTLSPLFRRAATFTRNHAPWSCPYPSLHLTTNQC
jgi:hypothetical protein